MFNPRPVVEFTLEGNSTIIISSRLRHRSGMTSLNRSLKKTDRPTGIQGYRWICILKTKELRSIHGSAVGGHAFAE